MTPADRNLWQRFWAIASPYWRQDERLKAWGLLALLVLLLLGQTRFAVLFNEQTGEFTSALAARDEQRFWDSIKYCLGLLAMAVPIFALYLFRPRHAWHPLATLADPPLSGQLLQPPQFL
jgi:putative ATP-binding cassette transporter